MVTNEIGCEYALWDGDPEMAMYMKCKGMIPGWFEWSDLEVRDREVKVKMILLRIHNIKTKLEQEGFSVESYLTLMTPLGNLLRADGETPF